MSHVRLSSSKPHKKRSSTMPIEMLTSISNPQRLRHDSLSGYGSSDVDEDNDEADDDVAVPDDTQNASQSVYTDQHDEPEIVEHHVTRASSHHRSSQPSKPVSLKISRPLPPPVQIEETFYDLNGNDAVSQHSSERSMRRKHKKDRHHRSSKPHRKSHRRHGYASSDAASVQSSVVESVKASVPVIYVDRDREAHERSIKHAVNDFAKFREENARDDEDLEKQELLYRIQQLQRDGYQPSKQMDMDSTIDEVRYELYRLTRDLNKDKSLKWYANSLITGSRMLEMANSKFDPFGLKLNGFSRNVTLNIDDFTPSLAAIHAQYSGRSTTTNPIVQLVMTLIGTLLFHHVSVVAQEESQREKPLSATGKVISQLAGAGGNSGIQIKKQGISKANPFSMLSGIFGSKPATETAPPARQTMHGPPNSEPSDDEAD